MSENRFITGRCCFFFVSRDQDSVVACNLHIFELHLISCTSTLRLRVMLGMRLPSHSRIHSDKAKGRAPGEVVQN